MVARLSGAKRQRVRPLNSIVSHHTTIVPCGVYRRVVITGNIAWKFPRWRRFAEGMRSNRWEREMWNIWRPIYGWRSLCPVLFADPLGLVVVMPRADQPVTRDEVDALPDCYPGTTAETKVEDHGRFAGNVVELDYGLPDDDLVRDKRAYYKKMAPAFAGRACDG
jgi:hypothetical protein